MHPLTIGNHIRKRRLELGWLQREVASAIGAETATVFGWEMLGRSPALRFLPAIIKFLDYSPLAVSGGFSAQFRAARHTLGLSQRELARRLGVDRTTITRCEAGRRLLPATFSRLAVVLSMTSAVEETLEH